MPPAGQSHRVTIITVMARALNTLYQGRSFDDMIKPLKEYYSAYKEVDEKATALNDELGKIQNYIDDSVSGQFNAYDASLKDAAVSFSGGMTAANRAQIENLRKTYGRTIVPIQDAITNKQKAVETQLSASLRDQSTIFEDVAYDHPLADFMTNPTLTQNSRHVSLNDVQNEAYKLAQNLQSELTGYGKAGQIDEEHGLFRTQKGYTKERLLAFFQNPTEKQDPALYKIVDQVYKNSGVGNWEAASAQDAQNKVKESIASGLWSALGSSDVSMYTLPQPKETAAPSSGAEIEKEDQAYLGNTENYYIIDNNKEQAAEGVGLNSEKGNTVTIYNFPVSYKEGTEKKINQYAQSHLKINDKGKHYLLVNEGQRKVRTEKDNEIKGKNSGFLKDAEITGISIWRNPYYKNNDTKERDDVQVFVDYSYQGDTKSLELDVDAPTRQSLQNYYGNIELLKRRNDITSENFDVYKKTYGGSWDWSDFIDACKEDEAIKTYNDQRKQMKDVLQKEIDKASLE